MQLQLSLNSRALNCLAAIAIPFQQLLLHTDIFLYATDIYVWVPGDLLHSLNHLKQQQNLVLYISGSP